MSQGPQIKLNRPFLHAKRDFELFSRKRRFWLILVDFDWFFRLWGRFWEPKLDPIVLAMEEAIVRHVLRNISGPGKDGIGAGTTELQCKTSDFQNLKLWGQFSPLFGLPHWPKSPQM